MASGATESGPTGPRQGSLGDRQRFLTTRERLTAGAVGIGLLVGAVWVGVFPPDRMVPVGGCSAVPSTCTVRVDADLGTLAIAIVAAASAALLVGLFGVRFTSVKAAGVELASSPTEATPKINVVQGPESPAAVVDHESDASAQSPPPSDSEQATVEAPSVVTTTLPKAMSETDPLVLRAYQSARRASRRGYFLTHVLGPPTTPGQKYAVALKIVAHRSATGDVQTAMFYLGRSWGHRVFEGRRGDDGRFGVSTEAYGPFLALCELTFADGYRVLLDHYCDFEMGALVPH